MENFFKIISQLQYSIKAEIIALFEKQQLFKTNTA